MERPQDPELRAITDSYDASTKAKCGVGWYEAASRFVAELTRGLRERSIAYVDMQRWTEERDFLDQVHLREEAHQELANKGEF